MNAGEKGKKMLKQIDAEKIIEYKASDVSELTEWQQGWNDAIDTITDEILTVDVVEVVRCQDCESWGLHAIKKDEKGEVMYGDCLHFCVGTPKWFYCAWGERKEDAKTV